MPQADNTSSQLSVEDTVNVNKFLVWSALKLQEVISTVSDPKDYARVLLKKIKSRRNLAYIRLLLNTTNDPFHNIIRSPDDLNRHIAEQMVNETPEQDVGLYISRSNMTRVIKKAEKLHMLLNIRGKRKIKSERLKEFGVRKKSYHEDFSKLAKLSGTGWSDYKIHPNFAYLKREILSKPETVELIDESLKKSGLLHKALKAVYLSELHTIRMMDDEQLVKSYFKATVTNNRFFGVSDFKNELNKLGVSSFMQHLRSLSDAQLDELVEKTTAHLIDSPMHHNYILLSLLEH